MNIVITFGIYIYRNYFSSFVENNSDTKIYCTQLTADLVVMRQNVTLFTLNLIKIFNNCERESYLDRKVIPVIHNIGSVMFLFDDSNTLYR